MIMMIIIIDGIRIDIIYHINHNINYKYDSKCNTISITNTKK